MKSNHMYQKPNLDCHAIVKIHQSGDFLFLIHNHRCLAIFKINSNPKGRVCSLEKIKIEYKLYI